MKTPVISALSMVTGSDQSGGLAGLRPLLSEEAGMKEQVKAARAAEFDTKVQSGLEEVEPEPDAADIKTAAPAAPTAAKVNLAVHWQHQCNVAQCSECCCGALPTLGAIQIIFIQK